MSIYFFFKYFEDFYSKFKKKSKYQIISVLVDIVSNGWNPICWAFLRPGNGKTFSNIDIRCQVQLHHYQRQRSKQGIIDEWKAQKRM